MAKVLSEVEDAKQAVDEAQAELLAAKKALRQRVKKATRTTLCISLIVGVPLIQFGQWLDDYTPPWIAIPIVLAIEICGALFALAAGVAVFDHLQAQAETEVGLETEKFKYPLPPR